MTSSELDVRLYNAAGLRLRFPREWWTTLEFEIGERGGYQNGSIQIVAPWEVIQPVYDPMGFILLPEHAVRLLGSGESLQLTGAERLDVWLFGRLVYRGWLRLAQSEIGVPERSSPTLYGAMEALNGYLVRRCFCYPNKVDISRVFADMAAACVTTPGRRPAMRIDTTGVMSLGIQLQSFCAKGKTFSQAMNALCDLAPEQLIWGAGTDNTGNDVLYLHPRATAVGWKFAIGNEVSAFVYPLDTTQVVNRVYVTGADLTGALTPDFPPNLCPNASFEDCALPGADGTNFLQNAGFENGGGGNIPNWSSEGGPTIDAGYAHGSGQSVVLDNNPDTPEGVYQDIPLTNPQTVTASAWALVSGGQQWSFQIRWQLLDSTKSNVLATRTSPLFSPPSDTTWRQYSDTWVNPPAPGGVAYLRVVFETPAPGGGAVQSGGHGLNLDDTALFFPNAYTAQSWQMGANTNATFSTLDWQNQEIPPYDGGLMVKAVPAIHMAGGYAEITMNPADRPGAQQNSAYALHFYVYTPTAGAQVLVGARAYQGATFLGTLVGAPITLPANQWSLCADFFTTGNTVDHLEPFLRLLTDGATYYIDAAGLFLSATVPQIYYPGSMLQAVRDVTDYVGQLPPDAAASITTWGEREKAETQNNILDVQTLDAYCIGYFKAHATPTVQARLTLKSITQPVDLSGLIQLVNLPDPPPPLCPARLRYQIGESIDLDIDLGNEKPDLALLIRQAGQADLPSL